MRGIALLFAISTLTLLATGCDREQRRSMFGGKEKIRVAETVYPENVYFGDTHLHTSTL